MRRLLLALGLSVVVGGSVLGAAASLNMTSVPLSAGTAVVASCDTDGVNVTWDVRGDSLAFHHFKLDGVILNGVAGACYGHGVKMIIMGSGGQTWFRDDIDFGWWNGGGPINGNENTYWKGLGTLDIDPALVVGIQVVIQS